MVRRCHICSVTARPTRPARSWRSAGRFPGTSPATWPGPGQGGRRGGPAWLLARSQPGSLARLAGVGLGPPRGGPNCPPPYQRLINLRPSIMSSSKLGVPKLYFFEKNHLSGTIFTSLDGHFLSQNLILAPGWRQDTEPASRFRKKFRGTNFLVIYFSRAARKNIS